MQNKISVIDGAVAQCYTFLKGGTVTLKGLYTMTVGRKAGVTNDDINAVICKLHDEREALQIRVNRMMK